MKWTSCPTENFEPNLVPWEGASREGQAVGAVGENKREHRRDASLSLLTSSASLCLWICTCHWAVQVGPNASFTVTQDTTELHQQPSVAVSHAIEYLRVCRINVSSSSTSTYNIYAKWLNKQTMVHTYKHSRHIIIYFPELLPTWPRLLYISKCIQVSKIMKDYFFVISRND